MKTISVADDTWERLQAHAVPLVDDADSVVRKLLKIWDEAQRGPTAGCGASELSPLEPKRPMRDDKASEVRTGTRAPEGRRGRSIHTNVVLARSGHIQAGTEIGVLLDKLPRAADADARQFRASFAPNARDVIWRLDGQTYSISGLSRKLCVELGVHANPDSENGYRVFGLVSDRSTSLEKLRMQVEGRV
jgi:hypothetical protein